MHLLTEMTFSLYSLQHLAQQTPHILMDIWKYCRKHFADLETLLTFSVETRIIPLQQVIINNLGSGIVWSFPLISRLLLIKTHYWTKYSDILLACLICAATSQFGVDGLAEIDQVLDQSSIGWSLVAAFFELFF